MNKHSRPVRVGLPGAAQATRTRRHAPARALTRGFEDELGLKLETALLSMSEDRRASELVEQKYNHSVWTQRV